jgi:predicted nucleic acid-binding protein
MAKRATQLLASSQRLILTDLVAAECVYVLQSFYNVGTPQIAESLRAAFALPSIDVAGLDVLLRTLEIFEHDRLDFADAYLVASAEITGVGAVASFDKAIDRVKSVRRITS